jgi:hypothetical protein
MLESALLSGATMPRHDRRRRLCAGRGCAGGECLHLFETVCVSRGACRREPLADDAGLWTWCPDCLKLFDDYGSPVNPMYAKVH